MLAILGGTLALALGLAVLLLPLLLPELSRARDAVWGAVVLLLGLVLVTSAERLTGAPMLGVLCGGLLIGRLGLEVAQGRWRQLSADEQQRIGSSERWQSAVQQLVASVAQLITVLSQASRGLGQWLGERRQPRSTTKRWVRPEAPADNAAEPAAVVASFSEIDALLDASDGAAAGDSDGTAAADSDTVPPPRAADEAG